MTSKQKSILVDKVYKSLSFFSTLYLFNWPRKQKERFLSIRNQHETREDK